MISPFDRYAVMCCLLLRFREGVASEGIVVRFRLSGVIWSAFDLSNRRYTRTIIYGERICFCVEISCLLLFYVVVVSYDCQT